MIFLITKVIKGKREKNKHEAFNSIKDIIKIVKIIH